MQNSSITVASNEPMAGGFRGWYVAEWNADVAFGEAKFKETKSQGQPSNFARMLPRREGIQRDKPLPVDVPGPAWMGAGADSYVLPEQMKPSRIGGVRAESVGNAPGLRKSKGFNSGVSVTAIGSVSQNDGDATGLLDLIDMNGDWRARLRHLQQRAVPRARRLPVAGAVGMTFGSLRSIANHNMRFGFAAGSAASAVANALKASGTTKSIVSVLPSFGLNYGQSTTGVDLVDVNGDGLPDHLSKSPSGSPVVQLNLGYMFGAPTALGPEVDPPWTETITSSNNDVVQSLMPSVNPNFVRAMDNATNSLEIGFAGIGGGVSYSRVAHAGRLRGRQRRRSAGRGAQGSTRPGLRVKLNLGTRFAAPVTWNLPGWPAGVDLERPLTKTSTAATTRWASRTASRSTPASASHSHQLLVVCIMIEISEQIGLGQGWAQLAFEDIDGDGKPDHVLKRAATPTST